MISHSIKLLKTLRGRVTGAGDQSKILEHMPSIRARPGLLVSASLAIVETAPAIFYGRYLIRLEPVSAALSIGLSFIGTWATYLLVIELAAPRAWLRRSLVVGIAIWTVLLQILYFGIYREFATLPTVSVIDFVRQTPEYAWALFVDRLDLVLIGVALLVVGVLARFVRWGFANPLKPSRKVAIGLGVLVLASYCYTRAPFMSFGQQVAWLLLESSHGPGVVNVAWTPDRARVSTDSARHPVNVVVFRLEEIAAQATTLERPDLPTMPKLKALLDEHPDQAFLARRHFANSTATDVSVLSIYTGLSPAAALEAHRRIPILWDYFSGAGYDTSMFIPFHLEWGDFKRRFNARSTELHLNKLVDAGNSGLPIVYDNSINDVDVVAAALEYQRKRAWREPFLQIVSLKMPHAIGEGARVNKLSYGEWANEPAYLKDYYNGIRHNDDLIQQFMAEVPTATREKTVFVFLSDHGTRLFPRSDGVEQLHRLDNYHQETTKVPFLIYLPDGVQQMLPAEKVQALKANLSTLATSNIDVVPTLVGLAGIKPVDTNVEHAELLQGRDLSRPVGSTMAIVQLNTGALRRWQREHFGLLIDNGRYHYMFSMGRELLFDRQVDPQEEHNVVADSSHWDEVAKARAIVARVPELLRIQRKYKRRSESDSLPLAQAASSTNRLTPKVLSADVKRMSLAAAGGTQTIAKYSIPALGSAVTTTEFALRGLGGRGRVEWKLSNARMTHRAHVEAFGAGQSHHFAFRWRPGEHEGPLEVTLYGAPAAPDDFSLSIEKAVTRADVAEGGRSFEVLALETNDLAAPRTASYKLDRFRQHQCLSDDTADECPNGYLVWGPYIKAAKGTSVRLRYDLEVNQPGVTLWFDLAGRAGKQRIAQSRSYEIDAMGSHSFELNARLDSEADALEGRLNAFARAGLKDHAVKIRGAELSLDVPAKE